MCLSLLECVLALDPYCAMIFACYAVPLGFLTLMIVAQIVRKFSGDAVNFLRWTLLMLLSAIVVTIYIIIFPRYTC